MHNLQRNKYYIVYATFLYLSRLPPPPPSQTMDASQPKIETRNSNPKLEAVPRLPTTSHKPPPDRQVTCEKLSPLNKTQGTIQNFEVISLSLSFSRNRHTYVNPGTRLLPPSKLP